MEEIHRTCRGGHNIGSLLLDKPLGSTLHPQAVIYGANTFGYRLMGFPCCLPTLEQPKPQDSRGCVTFPKKTPTAPSATLGTLQTHAVRNRYTILLLENRPTRQLDE